MKIKYEDIIEMIYNEIERQRNKNYIYERSNLINKQACDNIEANIHKRLFRLKKELKKQEKGK